MLGSIWKGFSRTTSQVDAFKSSASCLVCGNDEFIHNKVIWPDLIREWQLSPEEAEYIDRQQGSVCKVCGSNLRSIALAKGIIANFRFVGLFQDFVCTPEFQNLSILEVNEAGQLTRFLQESPLFQPSRYPEVDMKDLPFKEDSFDLVVHSDTLEHVEGPIRALSECYRVLKPGGALCFTVPIVVGRMTRDRYGLSESYHGDPTVGATDFVVHSEYGADAWTQVMRAGFDNVSIFSIDYPIALALTARKPLRASV